MCPDQELLRQYAESGDESAFTELVRRHVNWIYSSALRLVGGDAHLAQDVAQVVFADCARNAAKLSRYDAPGGWLHTATRYAAAKAVDREQRRRAREQEASAMPMETPEENFSWEQLRPVLDEAIGRLSPADRSAIVMRFFEGKSHREIGDLTGLSEDTARKRVERALGKLRARFMRCGVTLSAELLAQTMGANSVQAAPATLAETISASALANAGASTGIFYLLLKPLFFMTTTSKVILAAAVIITAAASYHYAVSASPAAPEKDSPANTAGSASTASSTTPLAKVEMPQASPAPVAPRTAAPAPAAVNNAGDVAGSPPASSVDPKTQDAMAMMQPMKALYGEIYSALMQTDDPDTALQKLEDLQPQLDALMAKAKGTNLEQILKPVLAQFNAARVDLEHGDIAGAQKIMKGINQIGAKTEDKIETTAGITIEQAAAKGGQTANTN